MTNWTAEKIYNLMIEVWKGDDMDSGRGHMEEIPMELHNMAEQKWPKQSGVFRIGEELEIKGAWFRVKKINPFGIMLKAIPSKATR